MFIKYLCTLTLSLILFSLWGNKKAFAQQPITIKLSGVKDSIDVFEKQRKKHLCHQLPELAHSGFNRPTMEMLIMCRALYLGGLDYRFEYKFVPNYSRALFAANSGQVAMPYTSIWQPEIDTRKFYQISPIYPANVFVKGFFVPEHKKQTIEQTLNTLISNGVTINQALKKYRILTTERWGQDWQMIKKLGLQAANVSQHASLCLLADKGRGDIVLTELLMKSALGMTYTCKDQFNMVPVGNIKIRFPNSRHFIVSKKAKHSRKIQQALEKGLQQMRDNKEFEYFYYPLAENKQAIDSWQTLPQ
ncbi:hypothetical protein C2869_18470 [Saccharobesus litoralis]|uniref:Solute-binding protein family 3/N-terminal domain-containing protein n=1 Tax=Saccharobesus litoralis TaxID=2172099 RepID=A0A2S0VVN2_9ALTE|nr:hypothetical protein [Saccharobesus litoralis]AWB68276.1 hypothetical protein C2869_18470 [Saccharobesus litoralis]